MDELGKRLSDKHHALNQIRNGVSVFPQTQGELDAIAESKIGQVDITPEQRANAGREFVWIAGAILGAGALAFVFGEVRDFINSGKPAINGNLAENQPQLVEQTRQAQAALSREPQKTKDISLPVQVNGAHRYHLLSFFKRNAHLIAKQDQATVIGMIGDDLATKPISSPQQYAVTNQQTGTTYAIQTAPVSKEGEPIKMLLCAFNGRVSALAWASTTYMNGEARNTLTTISDHTLSSMRSCQEALEAFGPRVLK